MSRGVKSLEDRLPNSTLKPREEGLMYKLEILNPVAASEADGKVAFPAQRPSSLEGLTVGLIWNAKRGGLEALATAGELIRHKYNNVTLRTYEGSQPCSKELLGKAMAECDVFVGSTGD
jgi:hypothetical protein